MFFGRNRGFTLVELMVVIALIGILSAALITQVSKVRDTARAVKCKANLKNLAQAALNYGVDNRRLPWAGSHEGLDSDRHGNMAVHLRRGWVDWTTSSGTVEHWNKGYSSGPSFSGKGRMVTMIEGRPGCISVTNGVLWGYMGRELSTYICDAHISRYRDETGSKADIFRSYFMNGYFGYNKDYYPVSRQWRDVWLDNLSARGSAERLLLFAELPAKQTHNDKDLALDGVIETKIAGYNERSVSRNRDPNQEVIGFNHTVGKRYVAHVAYADGHVDVFHSDEKGLQEKQLKGLTYYLCNGYDLPADKTKWTVP